MTIIRKAEAQWEGDLNSGLGHITLGSQAFSGPYSFKARTTTDASPQTNPEELIGAAHAGCYSMAFSGQLTKAGHPPEMIKTVAAVQLNINPNSIAISQINLAMEAKVPGVSEEEFLKLAEAAKANCPVSKALAGVAIHLKAHLIR